MRILLSQINPLIGDLKGNTELILKGCNQATKHKAKLLITPELSLLGYPPKDLLLIPGLLKTQNKMLNKIKEELSLLNFELTALVGVAEIIETIQQPNLFNSIALINKNGWEIIARKQLLPTYDVFDEKRYFQPGTSSSYIELKDSERLWRVGITICEDIWTKEFVTGAEFDPSDPIGQLVSKDINLLINLSASPYSLSKQIVREKLAEKVVKRLHCPVIYLNQVGGNDELIFDGGSFALSTEAKPTLKLSTFKEEFAIWDPTLCAQNTNEFSKVPQEDLFKALVLGVRDYVSKCGFKSTILGLSGGIDSALVAVIATAALTPQKVAGILMPSPWSTSHSLKDAQALASRLHIQTKTIPIDKLMNSFDNVLKEPLGGTPKGLTAENLQSRIRGTILMAIANQNGDLLLSTGNKSELAVGYCTLYGDMNGGLSVIGDLYKTCVYELCKWLDSSDSKDCRQKYNLAQSGNIIGKEILGKAPSAELRPDQLDSDSLPDYSILDPILQGLIEEKLEITELVKRGYEREIIKGIQELVRKNEFKRQQAPPVLKVSNQAFGSGWRVPIAAK